MNEFDFELHTPAITSPDKLGSHCKHYETFSTLYELDSTVLNPKFERVCVYLGFMLL